MKEVVILDGVRTPFIKAGTSARRMDAQELGRQALVALFKRIEVPPAEVDEVILGCVAQPSDAANVSRVAAIQAGLPLSIPAFTVQRNCASSMQAVTSACDMIQAGRAETIVAGGTESLSNAPLIFNRRFTDLFGRLAKARTPWSKAATLATFRIGMLSPRLGLVEGLTDPTCGLVMGATAELLAREIGISRREQDGFALESHRRAASAREAGRLAREIFPLFPPPDFLPVTEDNGIRADSSMENLAKLRPLFDTHHGTVTAGNSSQISDGAVALLITTAEKAAAWGIRPLARIAGSAYAGIDPKRMGLGPVAAAAKLLASLRSSLASMQLLEINEAFAAQVLACLRVMESTALSSRFLDLDRGLGAVDPAILNVNGGAIALGHPVGSSGARLLLTLALELKDRDLQTGLAALCVGGGQGAAFVLERTSYTR